MEEEENNYTYIIIIERIKRETAERSLKLKIHKLTQKPTQLEAYK